MKTVIGLILISLLLSACINQDTQSSIFENPVCPPPCWENITPGFTTKADALKILSTLSAVDQPIKDLNQKVPGCDDEFYFTFFSDMNKLGYICILDGKVSNISFNYKLDLTIQEAIDLFGEPQSVLGIRSGEVYAIEFLNPQKGVAYGYYPNDRATKIMPEERIIDLTFFDPLTYELLLDNGNFSWHQMNSEEALKNMQSWVGFGNIDQYMTPLPHNDYY
jgi:hypothetical protein